MRAHSVFGTTPHIDPPSRRIVPSSSGVMRHSPACRGWRLTRGSVARLRLRLTSVHRAQSGSNTGYSSRSQGSPERVDAPLRGCGACDLRSRAAVSCGATMRAVSAVLVSTLAAASPQEPAAVRPFAAGDALFHREPRWLGADAALSVPLDGARTLWQFGDTFVATSAAHRRTESRMVRNTVALETGLDPKDASIEFAWGHAADGAPSSFFVERGAAWYWPGHGLQLESALV